MILPFFQTSQACSILRGRPKLLLLPLLHIRLTSNEGWIKLQHYIFNPGLRLCYREAVSGIFRVLNQSNKLGLMANFSWNPIPDNKLQAFRDPLVKRCLALPQLKRGFLNKCLSPKVACVQSGARSIHRGYTNKMQFTVSNTRADLCILARAIRSLKYSYISLLIRFVIITEEPVKVPLSGPTPPPECDFALWPSVTPLSSDVIVINVNHAGFTVCLFYGAVGRVELSPSKRAPAGRQEADRGIWTMFALILCRHVGLSEDLAAEQRLCCQSWVTANISR